MHSLFRVLTCAVAQSLQHSSSHLNQIFTICLSWQILMEVRPIISCIATKRHLAAVPWRTLHLGLWEADVYINDESATHSRRSSGITSLEPVSYSLSLQTPSPVWLLWMDCCTKVALGAILAQEIEASTSFHWGIFPHRPLWLFMHALQLLRQT